MKSLSKIHVSDAETIRIAIDDEAILMFMGQSLLHVYLTMTPTATRELAVALLAAADDFEAAESSTTPPSA